MYICYDMKGINKTCANIYYSIMSDNVFIELANNQTICRARGYTRKLVPSD